MTYASVNIMKKGAGYAPSNGPSGERLLHPEPQKRGLGRGGPLSTKRGNGESPRRILNIYMNTIDSTLRGEGSGSICCIKYERYDSTLIDV